MKHSFTTRLRTLEDLNTKIFEEEKKLELALSIGPIGVWCWNVKTDDLQWDSRMHRIFGTNRFNFLGRSKVDFFPNLHTDDRYSVEQMHQEALSGNKQSIDISYRFVSPIDRTIRFIRSKGVILRDRHGNPEKVIGVCIPDFASTCSKCQRFALPSSSASLSS